MIKSSTKRHTGYYISLILILLLGVVIYLSSGNDSNTRLVAVLMLSFCYVLWGIVHHVIHHDITVRVVLEYVLIGVLGIALALLVMR
jgi:hypothetical protein